MSLQNLQRDIVVGRMRDGILQTQVSVRGDVVVVGYSNTLTMQGFEVTYSSKAVEQFNDILSNAARVALGKG